MVFTNFKAQGTIEYLVILAVVVVISLVVVGLVTNVFSSPSQEITDSSSQIGGVSSGGISVVESVIDPQGDSLVKFSNNSSDVITLTRVSVGGVDNNFNEQLVGLDSKTFSLSGLSSSCPCVSGQASVKCEFKIEYTTATGISQTVYRTIAANCVNDSNAVNPNIVIQPIVAQAVVLEDGTFVKPWIVNDCNELQNMNLDLDANYILGNDINCYNDTHIGGILYNDGWGFTPVGDQFTNFTGSFNGNNYTVSNMFISNFGYVGLFGYSTGNISNIKMSNVDMSFSFFGHSGALVGYTSGSVSNCSSTGTLTNLQDGNYIGGLVGSTTGPISNSFSTVSILDPDESPGIYVGGLVGYSTSSISDSNSIGASIHGHDYAGGLVGYSTGSIFNSNSTSNVTTIYDFEGSSSYNGGLAGYSSGSISNCYATGTVNGSNTTNLGGLVGYSSGSIFNSYSTSRLLGGWDNVGGLVGYSTGLISNSYSRSSNEWVVNYVGGLVGRNDGNISNSYSSGDMYAWARIGGLVGYQYSGNISNSFSATNVNCSVPSGCTSSTIGGLVGTKAGGTLSNVWWYNSKTNCCGNGTCTSCTKGFDINAFYPKVALANDYNVPIQHNTFDANNWTFGVDKNWVRVDNNYPKLSWQ